VKLKDILKILSDNAKCYVSEEMEIYCEHAGIGHITSAPYHPMTQGKIERYHRTMKNTVNLQNYYIPDELVREIEKFVYYCNNERYRESLGNMRSADVYWGRA